MRGPGPSPMQIRPMASPSGDAARVVVTEYDLPITQRESELPWYNGADWQISDLMKDAADAAVPEG